MMKWKRVWRIALLCALCALFAAPVCAAERFCVVAEILPIMERPGAAYVYQDGYLEGSDIRGVVVYGNHVEATPLLYEEDEKIARDWLDLRDPDGTGSLGYIERAGIEPVPDYTAFPARPCVVRADDPALLLQPGKDDADIRLSKWGYALLRGEVVTAYGVHEAAGDEWVLLGFDSSIEDEGEDGGVGGRFAWARSRDLRPLADYTPDYASNDERLVPTAMRLSPFDNRGEEKKIFEYLTDDARARLIRDGFAIDPTPQILKYVMLDDMAELYAGTGNYTVDFITTDLFLHAYHLIFSRMLQKVEADYFEPRLRAGMGEARRALMEMQVPDAHTSAYETALDMLTVPLLLLSADVSPDRMTPSERARTEAARILRAEGRGSSAIGGAMTDYTQYRPRGHYAGNELLERYFRAMNFLGSEGLPLFDMDGKPILENVATAAMVVLALDATGETWAAFDGPIEYLIGTADDGSFKAYRAAVRRRLESLADIARLTHPDELSALAEEIRNEIAPPRIRDRETGIISQEEELATRRPEFRISGKRYTLDAYLMNQLTSPRVGSDEQPRNLPEGTDVMAALGSAAAAQYAKRNDEIPFYKENMARLKGEVQTALTGDIDDPRNATAYARWLRVLRASFEDSGSKQVFYRSAPWQFKKLLAASASWAELKHDTVLYTKQGGAEMGGGADWTASSFAPPSPRGYVEPDPQTFDAIVSALDRLAYFFEVYPMEAPAESYSEQNEYARKIADLRALCVTARDIAAREVRDELLTGADYAAIKDIARSFTASLLLPNGTDASYEDWEKLRMAVVTDVATDFVSGAALHVATGVPRAIRVFVNDRSGGPRIAKGYVYSYYEFAGSLAKGRMTDDEWRTLVYDKERAKELELLHPIWYEGFDAKPAE